MKTTKLFFMAALALTFAACSNDDNDFENPAQQPAEAQGIPFTATISMGGDKATTRALSENGSGGLTATWTEDEEVALIHNGIIDKVTVASVSGNDATISGTITTDADGADVTVIFPYSAVDLDTKDVKADLLYAQSGATLADVASKYDVRKGTGKLQVSGDPAVASLNGNVSLTNQFAIMKLTLANDAKNLCIMADNITIAGATLGTEGTEFYVAVPAVTSKTVTIVANDASNNCYYYSKAGVSLAAGRYYQSSPTMTALGTESSADVYKITATSDVTIPDGKTVVLSGVNISSGSITCNGSVTMILMGANTVTATATGEKAAIKIGGSGTTLTITGSGSLTAQGGSGNGISSIGGGAGIGMDYTNNGTLSGGNIVINGGTVIATGGFSGAGIGTGLAGGMLGSASITCGDITINGGTVIATGGQNGAGIGTGMGKNASNECGAITIYGGTVTATGGIWAAGIGTGASTGPNARNGCGAITIGTGVISVTAKKSSSDPGPNSIGKGDADSGGTQACGTITIGGDATTYATGVTTSPFTYPAP